MKTNKKAHWIVWFAIWKYSNFQLFLFCLVGFFNGRGFLKPSAYLFSKCFGFYISIGWTYQYIMTLKFCGGRKGGWIITFLKMGLCSSASLFPKGFCFSARFLEWRIAGFPQLTVKGTIFCWVGHKHKIRFLTVIGTRW